MAFRVNTVAETLTRLAESGVKPVDLLPSLQEVTSPAYSSSFHVAYVRDPDGNWIEFYDHPDPIGKTIPEGY